MNEKDRPTLPDLNRVPLRRPCGEDAWPDLTPTRFVLPIPEGSQKGPVRAREHRAGLYPNLPALDPEGTSQLPSQTYPPRTRWGRDREHQN